MEIITLEEWSETFSTRLRDLMDEKGIKVPELSNLTNIREKSLYNYLHKETVPYMTNIYRLAKTFDTSPGYLIGVDPSPVIITKKRSAMTRSEYRAVLSSRILKAIDKCGSSQTELARKSGMCDKNISNYVCRNVSPDAYGLTRIIFGFVDIYKSDGVHFNKKYLTDFALEIVPDTTISNDKEWRDTFASKIQILMDEHDMTQTQLGLLTGITTPTIHKYLYGSLNASVVNVIKMAEVFNVDPIELMGLE